MGNSSYTVSKIAEVCRGNLIYQHADDPVVSDLLIDSRQFFHPQQCLFIALRSGRNDGHKYIPELYKKGMRLFLVSEALPITTFPDACFIEVPDTLAALQQLAAFHRSLFDIPVIGITGSNGKTMVKEWLFQLLSREHRIIRSPKSYNSQIGVPLSVWKMEPCHDLAIFEAGISRPGEMERLAPVIAPGIGLFTNIGAAHDENFTDSRQKAEEKLKLFAGARTLVYCSYYPLITACLEDPAYHDLKTFTWSRTRAADLMITAISKKSGHTEITGKTGREVVTFTIPFTDEAAVENILHCWALMLVLGYSASGIIAPAATLAPIAMRLELKEAINHCSLVNDSYNSDLNSLSIAIAFLNQQTRHRKKTVILSDILQTGREKSSLYREIGELFARQQIDRVIGIGRDLFLQADKFAMEKSFFETTDDFLNHFPFSSFREETILLKGARIFEFEKISSLLQQKSHETVLEVNLDAVVHNLNYFRSLLRPGTRTMAMVKAFAYGNGSYEIAGILQYHRVDYLAVAYADEGVELRRAGIHLPIMVMSPEEQSLETLLKFNLEPEIYNLRILGLLEEAMNANQVSGQEEVRIHIKLDTGMHRLGFEEQDIEALMTRIEGNPNLRVQSLFSHLAASEDPNEDGFTREQIARFVDMSKFITHTLAYPVLRHIVNSAGITRFPEAHFDMVRMGIGLYGVGFDEKEQGELRNVSTLKSVITQIKRVKAGDTVGYNRSGVVDRDKIIATIPIGYADGLNRRLGNGIGKLYIHGRPAPVIGNICMDLTLADISGIAEPGIAEGEKVTVFDDEHPVSELAARLGTIPYEVLTGISRRVKRIYYHE